MLAKTPKRAHVRTRQDKAAPFAFAKRSPAALASLSPNVPSGPGDLYGGRLLDRLTSEQRKTYPMTSGLLDYFPDACAAVANVSWAGNEKHNPGQALHWARGKSMDHADCILRHLTQRGTFDTINVKDKTLRIRHSAALAWRALALLQEEIEADGGTVCPRGASDLPTS